MVLAGLEAETARVGLRGRRPPAGAGTFEFASEAGKREEAEAGAVNVNVRVLGILLRKEKNLIKQIKQVKQGGKREIQKTTNQADRSKSTCTCCGLG